MSTVVFSGGVGGARFLSGLCRVMDPSDITVISNIGDDSRFFGLYVCPDIDIVIYTLANRIDSTQGWGLSGDSYNVLDELKNLGHPDWFHLGDRDIATHLHRTLRLDEGWTLSQVTAELTEKNGLTLHILPASNQPIPTRFRTAQGELSFQEYMVKYRWDVDPEDIYFAGVEKAVPAPGVLEAISGAERILFAPSNPLISLGAILAIPGIREAVEHVRCPVVAVSPIVGGQAIKGPAARLMKQFGLPVSPVGVARQYLGLVDTLVIDRTDGDLKSLVEAEGMACSVTDTMMVTPQRQEELARFVLEQTL